VQTERRYKILAIHPENLIELFQGGVAVLPASYLPKDTRVVGAGHHKERWMFDPMFDQILVILESSEWPVVPEGEAIAYLDPTIFYKYETH
jgi:hypothetical protein